MNPPASPLERGRAPERIAALEPRREAERQLRAALHLPRVPVLPAPSLQPQNLRVQPPTLGPAPQNLGGLRGPRKAAPQKREAPRGRLDLAHGRRGGARRKLGGENLRQAPGIQRPGAASERLSPARRRLGGAFAAPGLPRYVRHGLSG